MDGLVRTLRAAGFGARKPGGSFFLYVRAPRAVALADGRRREFATAEAASQWLITERLISTVPWDDVGAYLRFSVTFLAPGPAEEGRVLAELGRRLGDVAFEF
jgi:LL-diaminopimelate aminotransferase